MMRSTLTAAALLAACAAPAGAADAVEVMHWWTSGPVAAVVGGLKETLRREGVAWTDLPVVPGGAEQAVTVLRARAAGGHPPTAAAMSGADVRGWADAGALADLSGPAAAGGWETAFPAAVRSVAAAGGTFVAVPVGLHATNRIFASRAVFDRLGLPPPSSWDELVAALDAIKAAGLPALAHGGQPWQDAALFEAVVVATGGPSLHRAAFVDRDPAALGSDAMRTAFARLAALRAYIDDKDRSGDWRDAAARVADGKAGLLISGDWVETVFRSGGRQADRDVLCIAVPGSAGGVTVGTVAFALFKVAEARRPAQERLAVALADPAFQTALAAAAGGVPARLDAPVDGLDGCARQIAADVAKAAAGGTLLGSFAEGEAAPATVRTAITALATAVLAGDLAPEAAANGLAAAVAAAR